MLRRAVPISPLLILLAAMAAGGQQDRGGVPVEVVATASEYVPTSTTITHPGHAYTDCRGATSYFGSFRIYGDSGSVSATADTKTHCETAYTPPTATTFTSYRRVNYTIAKDDHALYLLSCTQVWKPSRKERGLMAVIAGLGRGDGKSDEVEQRRRDKGIADGQWSECPAFSIGARYALSVSNTSDARLENEIQDSAQKKPIKLEYLSSASLPVPSDSPPPQAQGPEKNLPVARVHITSSPSGGEIYIDGKFFGNTPSDITLPAGEHLVKITLAGKEWLRSIRITSGEISLHAEIPTKEQADSARDKAIGEIRRIADAMKECPEEKTSYQDECKVHHSYVGPPTNVEWDVVPSKTARSPFQGVIEFSLPSRSEDTYQTNLSEKARQKCADRDAEMAALAAPAVRKTMEEGAKWREGHYRYEFDVGSDTTELIKMLWVVKDRENNVITSPATDTNACWVMAAKPRGVR